MVCEKKQRRDLSTILHITHARTWYRCCSGRLLTHWPDYDSLTWLCGDWTVTLQERSATLWSTTREGSLSLWSTMGEASAATWKDAWAVERSCHPQTFCNSFCRKQWHHQGELWMDQAAIPARVSDTGLDASCRPTPVCMADMAGKVLAFMSREWEFLGDVKSIWQRGISACLPTGFANLVMRILN